MQNKPDVRAQLKGLDHIAWMFLIYSAAHNTVNAFTRSESIMFFVFVVVGVVSVELFLHTAYTAWKDGRLVGRMRTVSLWGGGVAMFYATAGILAQAAGAAEWVNLHHMYVLPTSSPMMFLFAFLVQSVDPITNADRDATANEHLHEAETRMEAIEGKRLALWDRQERRRLKAHVQRQRLDHMWRESMSRGVRSVLKSAAPSELLTVMRSLGIHTRPKERGWLGLPLTPYKLLERTTADAPATGGGDGQARQEPPALSVPGDSGK